jgi:hypothetical protein
VRVIRLGLEAEFMGGVLAERTDQRFVAHWDSSHVSYRHPLFDNLPAQHIELNLVRRLTTPEVEELAQHVTHLRYRVGRP